MAMRTNGIDNHAYDNNEHGNNQQSAKSQPVKKEEKVGCGQRITNKINRFLENIFASIGFTIATHPNKTILICVICFGLSLIGVLEYKVENRGEKNWVSQSSDSLKHKDWVGEFFPSKFRQISIMLKIDSGNILTSQGLLDLLEADKRTKEVTTTYKAENGSTLPLSWSSICYSTTGASSDCVPASILEIWRYNKTLIQGLANQDILNAINQPQVRSPMTGQIMVIDNLIGGAQKNGTNFKTATVLRINYRLKKQDVFDTASGQEVDKPGEAFEEKFDEAMKGSPSGYTLYSFSRWAADDASGNAASGDLQFFVVGYILVIIYLSVMLGSFSRLNHKVYLSLGGIAVIGMSIGISYGLGSAFQMEKTGVHDVLPFLLLGIGVDDIFVIIQNWDNIGGPNIEKDDRTIPQKVSAAMRYAGVSILVTTVTDVCAFLVGASTILPALRSFCVWAAIGILAVFIYTITYFIALLTLDAERQKERRDACCCCIKLSDDWQPMQCSEANYFQRFVEKYYGPAILSIPGKIIILLITFGCLAGGGVGLANLEQDFDPNWFLPPDSSARQFTETQEEQFPGNGVGANVYTGRVDYYNEYRAFETMENELNNDEKHVTKGSVNSWYRSFHTWMNDTGRQNMPCAGKSVYYCRAPNETFFYKYLNEFLNSTSGQFFKRKLSFANTGKLQAASIAYQHILFDTSADEVKGMDSVQKYVKPGIMPSEPNSLLPFAYSEAYIGWETNKVITEELFRNILLAGLCVLVVTLFLLSNILASIYVLLCVVFSLIDLAGFMHFWDLTIDTVTTIIMVLAIGLTVDYSAHIAHGFMSAREGDKNQRMQHALEEISPAVFHGGFSTFLAFALLSASKSYVFFTFFKVFFLVVVFGMFHGLFFLPVLLSLIGPAPYAANVLEEVQELEKISNQRQNQENVNKPNSTMETNGNTIHVINGGKQNDDVSSKDKQILNFLL